MVQAERRKYHYIYKITRTDGSGKYYIGMHSTDNLDDGYFGSGQLLWKSIKKHGKEKHAKEILEFVQDRETLKAREKNLVDKDTLLDPLCMNLQLGGGEGGLTTDEHRKKFHQSGYAAMQVEKDHGACMRAVWKNHREKMLKVVTENRLAAITAVNTPAAILKKKETFAKIKHQQGPANSMFSRKWIHKAGTAKSVDQHELQQHLDAGWVIGRTEKKIHVKKLNSLQLAYEELKPICRNSNCGNVIPYKLYAKGGTSCSKQCSNATRGTL